MEFKVFDLLLSNIRNLPPKTHKFNDGSTSGFNKILDEINTKFTNIEDNINNLDGKNLPGALKEQLLNLIEQVDTALHKLIENEENFSSSESAEKQKLLNSLSPIMLNNTGKNVIDSFSHNNQAALFDVFKTNDGITQGEKSLNSLPSTKSGIAEDLLKDNFPSNSQSIMNKATELINGTNLFSKTSGGQIPENNGSFNILASIRNKLGNIKAELNKLGEELLNTDQDNILSSLYENLKTFRTNVSNNLKTSIDNKQQVLEKMDNKSNEDKLFNNVKSIVDSSIEKLLNLMNINSNNNINLPTSPFKNTNMLPLIEQFNKQIEQKILTFDQQLTSDVLDNNILDEKKALINKLFNGDVKKVLLNALNNENTEANYSNYSKTTGGADFNFINPTKVDIAFKETFLDNKKGKDKINNIDSKTKDIENNNNDKKIDYKVIKEISATNKNQQVKNEINGTDKNQNIDGVNKDTKTLNVRFDTMTINSAKDGNGTLKNIDENLQKNQITKEITNKLTDYIKFVKQENISKAELRLNIEDLGKLKILLTDAGDKINAKIYTDNDNVKNMVALAFDNIKDNLVQKGINLSQYNFYHLNKENQDQERNKDSKERKNNYVGKRIENIVGKNPTINALYA
jgi:hypothetical protein